MQVPAYQGIVLSHTNIYMACIVLTLLKTAIPPVPSTGYIRASPLHVLSTQKGKATSMVSGDVPPDNPNDNLSYLIRNINLTLIVLSSTFVIARLYVRKFVSNSLGLDDCSAVISLVSSCWGKAGKKKREVFF